jgi:hypothetical protein
VDLTEDAYGGVGGGGADGQGGKGGNAVAEFIKEPVVTAGPNGPLTLTTFAAGGIGGTTDGQGGDGGAATALIEKIEWPAAVNATSAAIGERGGNLVARLGGAAGGILGGLFGGADK